MKTFARLIPAFFKEKPKLLLFAFAAVAASGFGQTFFVSVFGGNIRAAFSLSNTAYGTLYSAATITSAVLLLYFGPLVDRWSLRAVSVFSITVLATGCALMGTAQTPLLLGIGFLCIRLGGQGMISHTGSTTAARFFSRNRGKAIAFSSMGFPLSEAILPALAVAVTAWADWRMAWLGSVAVLIAVVLPTLLFLCWKAPMADQAVEHGSSSVRQRQFRRGEVLKDPGFYCIIPAAVLTPFVVTALFFHQVALAARVNWSLELIGSAFTFYAVCHFLALVAGGPLTDRLGAAKALPFALLPIIFALLVIGYWHSSLAVYVYMGLIGATQGLAGAASNAIWAERYGVLNLGAIRSMTVSLMVLSTAAAPILLGYLLDSSLTIASIGTGFAIVAFLAAILSACAPAVEIEISN